MCTERWKARIVPEAVASSVWRHEMASMGPESELGETYERGGV